MWKVLPFMVKDVPPPPRLSARWLVIIGVCIDALAVVLYFMMSSSTNLGPLIDAFLLTVFLGGSATLVGCMLWAWRASTSKVIALAAAIAGSALLYGKLARFGFDDPKVVIIAFAAIISAMLFVLPGARFAWTFVVKLKYGKP
jgi:hypothetical protein